MRKNFDDPIDEMCKFAELGKMSCGLFHDILSPINGLSLYLNNLTEKDEIVKPIQELSQEIGDFIRTINHSFEKPDQIEPQDISEIVLKSIKLLRYRALKSGAEIYFEKPDETWITQEVLAWYQVIINLISNSIDSLIKKEKVQKKIRIYIRKTGRFLKFCVLDNGLGIEKRFLDKIFTLFFTTKENGTGVGLYTVKRIVEHTLKGKISVASRPDLFTRFAIKIPENKFVLN